jgi:hypothetical protein
MLQITKFSENIITGMVDVEFFLQLTSTSETKKINETFATKENALRRLAEEKRTYFLLRLEKFVAHKKYILENSPGHKSQHLKWLAINHLQQFITYANNNYTLAEICKKTLEAKTMLENILPSFKNNSYNSSTTELQHILQFSQIHYTGNILGNIKQRQNAA